MALEDRRADIRHALAKASWAAFLICLVGFPSGAELWTFTSEVFPGRIVVSPDATMFAVG